MPIPIRKVRPAAALALSVALALSGCRSLAVVPPPLPPEPAAAAAEPAALVPVQPEVAAAAAAAVPPSGAPPAASLRPRPAEPSLASPILGRGAASAAELAAFLAAANPAAYTAAGRLAELYVAEAGAEGVNADLAFVQMCLETGFLRFGGLVTADMNNFCGLGSLGAGQAGERFASAEIGVRAHVQHLKGYASADSLAKDLVDPRFKWLRRGSAPAVGDLAGRWAGDPAYGRKLVGLWSRLYAATFAADPAAPAP
jgi:hypothetical protein